jgi:hypothetical protein
MFEVGLLLIVKQTESITQLLSIRGERPFTEIGDLMYPLEGIVLPVLLIKVVLGVFPLGSMEFKVVELPAQMVSGDGSIMV